jgi:O-acetyl-ADP-ribose deacetylase (regulator of RNase III)
MDAIVKTTLTDAYKAKTTEIFASQVEDYTAHQVAQAFKPRYHLNDDNITLLQSYFTNRYVIPASKGELLESSHPVLAALNQFSNEDARDQVSRHKERGYKVMSIGDSLSAKINAHHNCTLIRTHRDQLRVADNAFVFQRNTHNSRMIRAHNINAPLQSCCQNGSENCNYIADVAYAMHSLYDITPAKIVRIFNSHQITKLVAYVYFPFQFFHNNLSIIDSKLFNVDIEDGKINFNMNDFSYTYRHDAALWKSWSKITQIYINDEYTINIEVARQYGPLFILNFVLTKRAQDKLYRFIPLNLLCDNLCLVPDMTVAVKRRCALKQDSCPHITVPEHVVNHIMAYVTRVADEAYKYTEVAALASGLLRSVKIGSIVYAKRWETHADEYNRVLFSLFLLGAVSRQDRTKGLSSAFNNMKHWRDNIFAPIRQIFSSFISTIESPFINNNTGEVDPNEINSWYIWHYHIRRFMPYKVSQQVHVNMPFSRDEFEEVDFLDPITTEDADDPIDPAWFPPEIVPPPPPLVHVPPPFNPTAPMTPATVVTPHYESSIVEYQDLIDLSPGSINTNPIDVDDIGSRRIDYIRNMELARVQLLEKHAAAERERLANIAKASRPPSPDIFTEDSDSDDDDVIIDPHSEFVIRSILDDIINKIARRTPLRAAISTNDAIVTTTRDITPIPVILTTHTVIEKNGDGVTAQSSVHGMPLSAYLSQPETAAASTKSVLFSNAQSTPTLPASILTPKPILKKVGVINPGVVRIVQADLLNANDCIAHCVSADLSMHSGIAVRFVKKFANKQQLLAQKPKVGSCVYLDHGKRYVFYLVTKPRYDDKPTYATLRDSLLSAIEHMKVRGFKTLSVPRLGSGLDQLSVVRVEAMLRDLATVSGIDITIYEFDDNVNLRPDAQCPPKLRVGHCMIQSVAQAANLHYQSATLLKHFTNAALNYAAAHPDEQITRNMVMDYVNLSRGEDSYMKNRFTDHVFSILSQMFNLRIIVDNRSINRRDVHGGPDQPSPQHLDVVVYWSANHYTATPPGGAADKFPRLMEKFITYADPAYKPTFVELSAAPGMNFVQLCNNNAYRDVVKTALVYKPGIKPLALTNAKIPFFEYDDVDEIRKLITKQDYVFCDAARAINSEDVIDEFVRAIPDLCAPEADVMIKTFGNPEKVWQLATQFAECETVAGVGSEVYYILRQFGANSLDFNELRDKYSTESTIHPLPYSAQLVDSYARIFFKDIKIGKSEYKTIPNVSSFNVTAITGYASTAKTTRACEIYRERRFCFIAHSRTLCQEHTTKHAANSFTQHQALAQVKKYDVVIIDEISKYDFRYVLLVHSCNPKAEIVVLGDKCQTGPFAENYTPKTVFDYGIRNNLYKTYSVPKDIVNILNKTYGYTMQASDTSADNGLCGYKGDMKDLEAFPIIVMNDDTATDLKSRGYKANTISTYQGSREPVVVFYIDNKAIQSKLINHAEDIYTAMTRGTGKLVLYGDSNYLTSYLRINGLAMRTLEELSDCRAYNDTVVKDVDDPDQQSNKIYITEECQPADEHAMPRVAVDILKDTLKPVNPDVFMYNHDPNIPAVDGGKMTVNAYQLTPPARDIKSYVFDPTATLLRNQVSDDTRITVETLIKRYGKRTPRFKPRVTNNITNAMLDGLCKALYGHDHCIQRMKNDLRTTPEERSQAYIDYVKRLNNKIKDGAEKKIYDDLKGDFDEYTQIITFINKRQGKYDPEDGFDSKVKAGQGVASMDKKINILYAAYAQLLLTKCQAIAHRNGRKIEFATHGSDTELSDIVASLEADSPGGIHIANDIGEWDANFLRAMAKFTCTLIEWMGCPGELANWFFEYRSHWFMINRNRYGNITLSGSQKQFSGSPFTITENTLCNCALMFAIFDYKNFRYALFKGDDSDVKCDDAQLSSYGRKLIESTKHKLKIHSGPVGEFAGYLITPHGFFPDLVRKAAKFFGKNYRDNAHFNEAQKSAFACTSMVKTATHLEYGLQASEAYYNGIFANCSLTAECIRTLYYSLKKAHSYTFESLIPKVSQILM